jgi:hypothetical protein
MRIAFKKLQVPWKEYWDARGTVEPEEGDGGK